MNAVISLYLKEYIFLYLLPFPGHNLETELIIVISSGKLD